MLKEARQSKHGSHPTILSNEYEQEGYRKSLAEVLEKRKTCFSIASLVKDTTFTATRAERLQHAKPLDSSFER